jgi:adenine/guanine phosphoribosyltransferase-like PRPP-binding protein
VALEEILEKVGAEVADVGVVVDGGSASVELDGAAGGVERGEGLEGAGESVVEEDQGS